MLPVHRTVRVARLGVVVVRAPNRGVDVPELRTRLVGEQRQLDLEERLGDLRLAGEVVAERQRHVVAMGLRPRLAREVVELFDAVLEAGRAEHRARAPALPEIAGHRARDDLLIDRVVFLERIERVVGRSLRHRLAKRVDRRAALNEERIHARERIDAARRARDVDAAIGLTGRGIDHAVDGHQETVLRAVVVADLIARGVAELVVGVPRPRLGIADVAAEAGDGAVHLRLGADPLLLLRAEVLRDDRGLRRGRPREGRAGSRRAAGRRSGDCLVRRARDQRARGRIEQRQVRVVGPDAQRDVRRTGLEIARCRPCPTRRPS